MPKNSRTGQRPPMPERAPVLRAYPVDSPQARARLIVLALIADGERALLRNAIEAWVVGGGEGVTRPVRGRSMRRGRAMPLGA